MATYGTEDIPSSWDDDRDSAFFRITASLFSTEFMYGASVLLASYDETCEAPTPVADLPIASPSTPVTRLRDGVAR